MPSGSENQKQNRRRMPKPKPKTRVPRPANVPDDWDLLRPGDAALTRRVKAAGEHQVVTERRGRRTISLGIWAPRETIQRIGAELADERAQPAYQKRLVASAKRREKQQVEYIDTFRDAVERFLDFPAVHAKLSRELAEAVSRHATPVGSGTVARTKRISIERRAEAAVIAWLRHQTTAYDRMKIERIRGRRREVRRILAETSRSLLEHYRRGEPASRHCPIRAALKSCNTTSGPRPNG